MTSVRTVTTAERPMSPFRAEGAVAVVTGGASGIGRALCRALLAHGAQRVVVADIDGTGAERAAAALAGEGHRGAVAAIALDVSRQTAVSSLADQVRAQHGRIDLWCSNAGINLGGGLERNHGDGLGDPDEWARVLGVNLLGHVHAARAVIPNMVARNAGRFVITASAAGLLTDVRSASYAASKHAAVAFAEWLAIRHLGDGIGVHCVCPEGVRTAMTRDSSAKLGPGMVYLEADEVAAHILERIAADAFLILPHPRVAEYEVRRATDRARWLAGMNKVLVRQRAAALVEAGAATDPDRL